MATKLRSEIDSQRVRNEVKSTGRRIIGRPIEAVFEHGQWWVIDKRTGAQYSVVDTDSGFDLECVTQGDE